MMIRGLVWTCVLIVMAITLASTAQGGSFSAKFDTGLLSGTSLYGYAYWSANGGVGDSGKVVLTDSANGLMGSMIVEDLDAGQPVLAFSVHYRALIGGGTTTPADGMSFNFASDLPNSAFYEEGEGTGLTVAFDSYDNGGNEAPAIDVKWAGNTIGRVFTPVSLGSSFVDVFVELSADGKLDVTYNSLPIYTDFQTGYAPISGGRFGFGARTGGFNDNHWIDDLTIATVIPEPASGALLLIALAWLSSVCRRNTMWNRARTGG